MRSAMVIRTRAWTREELESINDVAELAIATPRPDGAWRRPVPIWVVCVDTSVYVRTWHRRDTGWFGDAVRSGQARIAVAGGSVEVKVDDLAADDAALSVAVDEAYRAKYGHPGDTSSVSGMVTDDAAATTLRLTPTPQR